MRGRRIAIRSLEAMSEAETLMLVTIEEEETLSETDREKGIMTAINLYIVRTRGSEIGFVIGIAIEGDHETTFGAATKTLNVAATLEAAAQVL